MQTKQHQKFWSKNLFKAIYAYVAGPLTNNKRKAENQKYFGTWLSTSWRNESMLPNYYPTGLII